MLKRILAFILIYSLVLLPVQPALSSIARSSVSTAVGFQTLSPSLALNEQNMRILFLDASTWDLSALSEVQYPAQDLIKENAERRLFEGSKTLSLVKDIFDSARKGSKLFYQYVYPKAKTLTSNSIFLVNLIAQIFFPVLSFAGIGVYMPGNNMMVTFNSDTGQVRMMTPSGKPIINYLLTKDGKKIPLLLTPGYSEKSILDKFAPQSELGSSIVNMHEDDSIAGNNPFEDYYKLTYANKDIDPAVAAAILNSQRKQFLADPNIIHTIDNINSYFDPNTNPYYLEQWGHQALNIPGAWEILNQYDSNEFPQVGLGVIDTGVWDTNPDMEGRVINPELSNFGDDNDNAHGSVVAATAVASNNDFGIIGPAYYQSVNIINAGGLYGGSGTTEDILVAIKKLIDLAKENGLEQRLIANCSYGASGLMENSVRAAWEAADEQTNIFIGPAAGNDAINFEQSNWGHYWKGPLFHPVSSLNINGEASYFSNYSQWMPYAPGENIISIFPDGTAWYVDGTSFSAPNRNGVVAQIIINQAMVHGLYSIPFDHEEIASIIWNTGDININPGDGRQMLVINAEQALSVEYPGVALIEDEDRNMVVFNGRPIMGTARVYGGLEHFSSYTLQIKNYEEDDWTTINYSETPVTNGVLGTLDENIPEGWYSLRLSVENTEGQKFEYDGNIGVNRSLVPGWPQEMPEWIYSNRLVEVDASSPGPEMHFTMHDKNSMIKTSEGNDVPGWENASESERPYGVTLPADINGDKIDELIVSEFPDTITVMNADGKVKWSKKLCGADYSYCQIQDMIVGDFDADKKPELALTAYVVDEEQKRWNVVKVFKLGNKGMKEIYGTKVPVARYGTSVLLFGAEAVSNKKNLGIGITSNDGQSRSTLILVDIASGQEIVSRTFSDMIIHRAPVSVDIDRDHKSEIFFLGLDTEPLAQNEPTVAEVYGLSSDLSNLLPGFPVRLEGIETPPIALATELAAGRTMGDDKAWRIVFGMEGLYDKKNQLIIVPIDNPQSTMSIMTSDSVNNPLIITVNNNEDGQIDEGYMQTLVTVSVNRGIELYDLETGALEKSIPYDDYPSGGAVAFNRKNGSSVYLSAGGGYHPVYKYADYPAEMFLMELQNGWVQWGEVRGKGQIGLPIILPFDKNDEKIDNPDDGEEDHDAPDDNTDIVKDPQPQKPDSPRGALRRSTRWLGPIKIISITSIEGLETETIEPEVEELKTMPEELKNNKESQIAEEVIAISEEEYPVEIKAKLAEPKVKYAPNALEEKNEHRSSQNKGDFSGVFRVLSTMFMVGAVVGIAAVTIFTVFIGATIKWIWERLHKPKKQAVEDADISSNQSHNKMKDKKEIFMRFTQHKEEKNTLKQTVSTNADKPKGTGITNVLQIKKKDILFSSYTMERSV